ncbi:unnamed protein product [Colias eurytheme]|nr:unnamed protein product [Colias eurytheme]
MKTISICLLLIIGTNCYDIANTDKKDNILLRKLQGFIDERENQTVSWSELLANIVVNKITVTFHKSANNETDNFAVTHNRFTNLISNVFKFFKSNVYDKIKGYSDQNNVVNDIDTALQGDKRIIKSSDDPNNDVEVFEPKYHGKLCENCNETTEIEVTNDCPEGYSKDENGDCVKMQISKFIVSVPNQCPIGYRPDWRGYCRKVMDF